MYYESRVLVGYLVIIRFVQKYTQSFKEYLQRISRLTMSVKNYISERNIQTFT